MAKKARFLSQPFSAHLHRDVPREDAELTHVGPGTPGGEYLRRFWQPIAFSDELKDLPRRLTIMGEDLVAFRDRSGRTGLFEWRCAHRGTSLEFGIPSERGLRCCYHGWLFDVDGRILDMPNEPAGSTLKDRLCQAAYPTLEFKGIVFAYMGPPDKRPEFPLYDLFTVPGYRFVPGGKRIVPCNWVQIKENSMDPVHTAFLHTIVTGTQFTDQFGVIPEMAFLETPVGMMYVGTRRQGDHVWVRISDAILPNIHLVPPIWENAREEKIFNRPMLSNWAVPIDDTHTMRLGFWHVNECDDVDWTAIEERIMFGQMDDRPYEERQRVPGDYDAQVGQGPIAVHAMEHLGSSDRGVIMFRKLLRAGIRAVKSGKDPRGVVRTKGDPIATYAQDTVLRVPPEATPEADRKLLQEIGRKVADGFYIKR
jgi:phenylpropionate dioxygenase-like ring-hydroxylating dioxygenase large terminal subunit